MAGHLCQLSPGEDGLEGRQDRTLESTFALPVWKDFVESPRPPPMVTWLHAWGGKAEETLELDVRRRRRNALAVSAHHFSVFSALDSITPSREGTLGDFSFVTLSPKTKNLTSLLPYTGPGWYRRVAVEHLLHYGVATWQVAQPQRRREGATQVPGRPSSPSTR